MAAVFASVLSAVAILLPWFHPQIGGAPIHGANEIHAWQGGRITLAGPILIVVAGILWVRQILSPNGAAGRVPVFSMVAGALGLGAAGLAWLLMPQAYRDWDEAESYAAEWGVSLGRGPQSGYWLLIVSSAIILAVGIAGKVAMRRPAAPLGGPPATG